ncbi:hypothetical protein ABH920_006585, partial [Catenulispora sp. EB89]|uniref:hypothetical protein n=1 Tax=Catenulispora sp. EB89 TaxID=3156257 RepID=UPI0035142A0E
RRCLEEQEHALNLVPKQHQSLDSLLGLNGKLKPREAVKSPYNPPPHPNHPHPHIKQGRRFLRLRLGFGDLAHRPAAPSPTAPNYGH